MELVPMELVLPRKLVAASETINLDVVLTPKPIVVPITLTAVPPISRVTFPRAGVSMVPPQHPSFLFPLQRLKLFKLPMEHVPNHTVLPRNLVAASETINLDVVLTPMPIAVPTTLTVVLVVTSAIFPRVNVSTERTVRTP